MSQKIVELLMAKGMCRTHAVMADDLANHAVKQALAAMQRVADSAPEDIKMEVMIMSMMFLSAHLDRAEKGVMEVFHNHGMPVSREDY